MSIFADYKSNNIMKLSEFNIDLPNELIATYPTQERDEARLMVINKKEGTIEHKMFKDIINYFDDKDIILANNTKVFPARLFGKKEKTGANIEVFLLRELNSDMKLWDVMVDPARKIRVGNKIFFGGEDDLVAEVVDNTTSRGRTIRFIYDGEEAQFKNAIFNLGHTPLPKYIHRNAEEIDTERYQTLFAKKEGAVAAPTAGLHFSKSIIKRLQIKGVEFSEITLHTGLASFNPIDVEDLAKYKMDAEYYHINKNVAELVNSTKMNGNKVCAIGTTTMRAIESSVTANHLLKGSEGWTNLFIFPPHVFSIANCMLTNFHMTKSSVMIMAAAFAGPKLLLEAYSQAIKEKYRFLSYGDAMLII